MLLTLAIAVHPLAINATGPAGYTVITPSPPLPSPSLGEAATEVAAVVVEVTDVLIATISLVKSPAPV